jgi:hypothetical protein
VPVLVLCFVSSVQISYPCHFPYILHDLFDFSGDQCPGASTTCPTGANIMQPPTKLSANDDQVIKAAMMTAEGAFNFMRSTISGDAASQSKQFFLVVALHSMPPLSFMGILSMHTCLQ